MGLSNIDFCLTYNSGDNDLLSEFYIPCFQNSIKYDRAVGFFSSNILKEISRGLEKFVSNNGKMRLICSPKFNEEDIESIEKGYKEREEGIYNCIIREIELIPDNIIDESINCLAWLIANNRLDIKIALPKNLKYESYGIYHEKQGLFYDDKDKYIAFYGSNNETLYGCSYNYESFDVYRNWIDEEKKRCSIKKEHFDRLWENTENGVEIYNFPQAIKKRIIEKIIPQESIKQKIPIARIIKANKINKEAFLNNLWDFQKTAIHKWKENKWRGIISMATGTGKTKTAVGGIIELKKEMSNIFAVIACPQNTIIKQWKEEINSVVLFDKGIIADGTNPNWKNELMDNIIDFNDGSNLSCVVYTTYNTLSSPNFIKIISNLISNVVVICDEVHWSGAETFRKGLLDIYNFRLGLSATPQRYMDEEGTTNISEYFSNIVYEFPLEKALSEINLITKQTFLCPYRYFPVFVELNEKELEDYLIVNRKIKQQYAIQEAQKKENEYLQRLYEQRQEIIVNASGKYQALEQILDAIGEIKYMLVYCTEKQIDKAQDILNQKNIINHRFTGSEGTKAQEKYGDIAERDFIISNFESGKYKALVAMKCLDEGVNILMAQKAIIMASSGNPKQYIQRRGRLLRRSPGKENADIYDIIVVPYLSKQVADKADKELVKIVSRELKRYEEFAKLSQNRLEALNRVYKIKEMYYFN